MERVWGAAKKRRARCEVLLAEASNLVLTSTSSIQVDCFAMANTSPPPSTLVLSRDGPLFVAYISLITLAVLPIYFGSFQSLRTPARVLEARKASRKGKKAKKPDAEDEDEDDEDDDDEPSASETLTSSDAWLFPVIGSFVLFSMYLVFKFLDRKWVDRVLGVYFGIVGFASVIKAFTLITAGAVGQKRWRAVLDHKVTITKRLSDKELAEERRQVEARAKKDDGIDVDAEIPAGRIRTILSLRASTWHIPIVVASALPLLAFQFTRHWLASNTIALSLALNAIALMGLDSFLTGSIMLGGLFFYDIFWVFGTEVMVSVARNFEAGPIKILFPKNLPQIVQHYVQNSSSSGKADIASELLGAKAAARLPSFLQSALATMSSAPVWQMTMLGLGDIVIPGIFIALALRFDQHLHLRSLNDKQLAAFTRRDTRFPKPYFTATLTAYVAGLATTMGVMHIFQAAQPALLYLSPACVAAVGIKAIVRGETGEVWSWKDAEGEEDKAAGGKDEKTK